MYRHPSLQPRKRINPINEDRRARLFAKHYESEEFVLWVKKFQCVVPGCPRRDIDVMHVRSKGSGGAWKDTVPCCHPHHMERHALGDESWAAKYGLDLAPFAAYLAARWIAETESGGDLGDVPGTEVPGPADEEF